MYCASPYLKRILKLFDTSFSLQFWLRARGVLRVYVSKAQSRRVCKREMASPPTTVIYYVPTEYQTRDWAGSDIALIAVLGVILLVVVTCSFAECYRWPTPDRRRRGNNRYAEYDALEGEQRA